MADPELLQAEQSAWERYWKMQDEGQEEFIQPEKNVHELIDQQVHDEFLRTVQRREDGYYVRLPWKEIPVALPDNRAIAEANTTIPPTKILYDSTSRLCRCEYRGVCSMRLPVRSSRSKHRNGESKAAGHKGSNHDPETGNECNTIGSKIGTVRIGPVNVGDSNRRGVNPLGFGDST
ncbi:unnamed protein product [Nippostrongylus brasiliensis]|uniref:Protein big brother (inferred by orthology to a D. melanogaster protein) n=1 Tax=Nippostrongylus brasiliensis TaxID=27835 RepID=A0A0N4YWQ8_NIPBR|nr:unnamed protein product [Nippostrongylus brasiliensis]